MSQQMQQPGRRYEPTEDERRRERQGLTWPEMLEYKRLLNNTKVAVGEKREVK